MTEGREIFQRKRCATLTELLVTWGSLNSLSLGRDSPTLAVSHPPPIAYRFLSTLEWFNLFSGMVESSLIFYDSDHRLLMLQKSCPMDAKPFRFQPHRFEEKKLISLLQGWWEELKVTGNAGYVLHKVKGAKR